MQHPAWHRQAATPSTLPRLVTPLPRGPAGARLTPAQRWLWVAILRSTAPPATPAARASPLDDQLAAQMAAAEAGIQHARALAAEQPDIELNTSRAAQLRDEHRHMTTPATMAFLDCETTGLDPDRHQIWEVALILRTFTDQECERPAHADGHHGPNCHAYDVLTDAEYVWQLPVDLGRADPIALNIGGFHDRRGDNAVTALDQFAREFAGLTRRAHLVGAVVSFDADRLWRLLRASGECPMWHYHLIDVEALVAGWLAAQQHPRQSFVVLDVDDPSQVKPVATTTQQPIDPTPPWDSNELSRAVGVDPDQFDRHTALGDARWARAIYDAVMGDPTR